MDAIKIFKNLGFIGKVYSTSLKRDEYIFINYEIVKKLKNKLRECEKKLINKQLSH